VNIVFVIEVVLESFSLKFIVCDDFEQNNSLFIPIIAFVITVLPFKKQMRTIVIVLYESNGNTFCIKSGSILKSFYSLRSLI